MVRNRRVDKKPADRCGFAAAEVEAAGFAIGHDITTTTLHNMFERIWRSKHSVLRCFSNNCGVLTMSLWRVLDCVANTALQPEHM